MRSAFALLVALVVAPGAQANPARDLLGKVPPDCSLCFVAQDWKAHAERVAKSPFAELFKKSEFGKAILNADVGEKFDALEKILVDALKISPAEVRDDILGDALVYAYRPGPMDKPDRDAGILLVKPAKPETLAKLIERFNAAQKDSGELKSLTEKKLGKSDYFQRAKHDGDDEFYFLRDGVFAYSKDESAIQQVLALEAAPAKVAPFQVAYDSLQLKSAPLAAIIQPRILDAELNAKRAATKDEPGLAFLGQFAKIWKATRAVAVAVELGADVELALIASFDSKTLPAEIKPFLSTPKPSALWSVIPPEALLAMAGRADLQQWLSLSQSFMGATGQKQLREFLDQQVAPAVGKDALPELLRGIGPDWGVWIVPPVKGKGVLPEVTAALRVRNPDKPNENSLADSLRTGLNFAFQAYRFQYNRTHDDQFAIREDEAVQYLDNPKVLPLGVRPAFGQRGDYIVVGTSPDAVKAVPLKALAAPPASAPSVRIGWSAIFNYLKLHTDDLAGVFAALSGKSVADVAKEFRDVVPALELLDRMELRQSGDAERTKWSLRIKTSAPLMK